ncbi:hypothetical protein [Polaribacter sp. Hel1_85]|uniref:hypothetical protein n=1 Tax=Polaribacter sp. Hel1_85 TaxID=1250005 RepID=UPI00052CD91D|nr:hypothetical protein [Polaribacter sp. Hel1_85]KGL62251.1 hypothetical protein PHEL85_2042 [Polaribacter sp. Hel1_85]
MINSINFSVINCLGYKNEPNAFDFLMFTLGSFVIISMLLLYYNRIPKSNHPISELDNPIYQTKDILLQSNSADVSFVISETKTSVLVKIVTFILILFLALTPFQEFLAL